MPRFPSFGIAKAPPTCEPKSVSEIEKVLEPECQQWGIPFVRDAHALLTLDR
jgi:hypothetical protein